MAPDFGLLRKVSKENLSKALCLFRGKKIIVIESKLTPTLDLIANFEFLKNHGVVKILQLETSAPPQPFENCDQVLYLIRSDLVSAKLVCDQINSNLGQGVHLKYGVVVVPRRLHIITSLFESEGVFGVVEFGQYAHEMIPLDEHILSLQFDELGPNLWLHGETSYLPTVAKAIFNLRGIYGDFHHFIAIGHYSNSIVNLMNEYELIHKGSLQKLNRIESDIPTVIIIDRSLDYVSPLLTPLTYEAMLDEIFGIRGKTITFPSEVTGGKDNLKHSLTSADVVFEKVRNLHFSKVVPQLLVESKQLKRDKEMSTSGVVSVAGIKEFVEKDMRKIQAYQKTLSLHLGALDVIIKEKANDIKKYLDVEDNILENVSTKEVHAFLEDSMAKGIDPISILRFFSLLTLAQDGIRDSRSLKTQFIQSYGFKHLGTLHNLEKMGLLYPYRGIEANAKGVAQVLTKVVSSSSSSSASNSGGNLNKKGTSVPFYHLVRKLLPPSTVEVDFEVPDHASYVYNGKYTPLVSKLAEEILSALISPKVNSTFLEKKIDEILKSYYINESSIKCKCGAEGYGRGRNALVFVVGGITRGEIAALQLIGRKLEFNIICGGTDITNGKKLISELIPNYSSS